MTDAATTATVMPAASIVRGNPMNPLEINRCTGAWRPAAPCPDRGRSCSSPPTGASTRPPRASRCGERLTPGVAAETAGGVV